MTSLSDLLDSARVLLAEVEEFAAYAHKAYLDTDGFECRQFINDIGHEIRRLEKIASSKDQDEDEESNRLTEGSNLTFYQAVWDTAKRSSDVIRLKGHTSPVTVVSDGGKQWTKVATLTEKRLLIEMAAKGWRWRNMSPDSDEEDEGEEEEEDEDEHGDNSTTTPRIKGDSDVHEISIFKAAQKLIAAASDPAARVAYALPRTTLVLPRLSRGSKPDVDDLLAIIQSLSPQRLTILTGPDLRPFGPPPPLSRSLLERMAHQPFARITATVNLDCTILLALISDISHALDPAQLLGPSTTGFSEAIRRQLGRERQDKLLPRVLWTALGGGRRLVCVAAAAGRMREIVSGIGTATERARAEILLRQPGHGQEDEADAAEGDQARKRMQELSEHAIPADWRIPIEVLPDVDQSDPRLAAHGELAARVSEELSPLNQSVFLAGWASGWTTVTSNRTTVKAIERTIVEQKAQTGPDVWVSRVSRSLLAKEKGRKE